MRLLLLALLIGCIALACSIGHGETSYTCAKHGNIGENILVLNFADESEEDSYYCGYCIRENLDKYLGRVTEVISDYRTTGIPEDK